MPPVNFTAIYMKVAEGFVGFIEELPGANTQGATLDEARENLKEAAAMVMEANRILAEETIGSGMSSVNRSPCPPRETRRSHPPLGASRLPVPSRGRTYCLRKSEGE